MIESCYKWFDYMWKKFIEMFIKRITMKNSLIVRDKVRSRKIIGKIIKWDLNFNSLTINIIYDKIICFKIIYIIDSI